jgi:hypothetical protein
MPGANWTKPVIYKQIAWLLLIAAVLCNEFALPMLQGWGWLPAWPDTSTHAVDVRLYLPRVVFVTLLSIGLIMLIAKKGLGWMLGHSVAFNVWCLLLSISLLLVVNPIAAGQFMALRVILLLILLFFLVNCLYLSAVVRVNMHPVYRNSLLAGFSLLFIFFLIEGIFMWVGKSHHQNDTLTSRVWFARHWESNELGYRDRPITQDSTTRKVLLVGDSFGAGHGVKRMQDRMGEVLESQLGAGWRVYNACYPGLDTRNEFLGMVRYPVKPDYIVLQWYPNDIEKPAFESGYRLSGDHPYGRLSAPIRFFVERSYLLNYLFWLNPKDERIASYAKFSERSFRDTKVMDLHQHDLGMFVRWSKVQHIPMVVVPFPYLGLTAEEQNTTAPIKEYFSSEGVPVVDVDALVEGKPIDQMVVNDADGHASALLHRLVGEKLAEVFAEQHWK